MPSRLPQTIPIDKYGRSAVRKPAHITFDYIGCSGQGVSMRDLVGSRAIFAQMHEQAFPFGTRNITFHIRVRSYIIFYVLR